MPGDGPAKHLPGSTANFWPLTWKTIQNQQWVVHPMDPTIKIFQEPRIAVTGTVIEVISEADGDHHVWLRLDDNAKSRFACEIDVFRFKDLGVPKTGQHVTMFGTYRYDLQHGWPETRVEGWTPT